MKVTNLYNSFLGSKNYCFLLLCLALLSNCESFLETDSPIGQILQPEIFDDEATATAAVTTMYAKLRDEVLLSGNTQGLSTQMGLYADELDYYGASGQPLEVFYTHQFIGSDLSVARIWNSAYNLTHTANSAIEGLQNSQNITVDVKNQLIGESIFIRALIHFYLVNIFGDIPYIKTTNFDINRQVSRMPKSLVYENIISDLIEAKSLLAESYVTNERIRANTYVVSALLSRVYLYTSQWENAELESSSVINNTTLYSLEMNLENVFLKTSQSAILQLKTKVPSMSTTEALTFVFTSGPPPLIALNESFVNTMEANDLRRLHWVGEVTNGSETWYYPKKYNQGTNLQYSTVFRLAEQYLIRAEARTQLNDIIGAQNDINSIRQRSGLSQTDATTRPALLQTIIKERLSELFTEHGHRWFDLRRFEISEEILAPIKPAWSSTDILFPIPELEILMNPNLNPQNPGY